MSCHSLLACRVSAERSAVNLMGIPLHVICCFSFAAFNNFSLYLFLIVWLICVLACFSLDLSCMGLCPSCTWVTISFPLLRKFSTIISSNIFLVPLFFSSSFWDPYNLNVGTFNVVPEFSETVLKSFHSFSLFCSMIVISTILSSRSLILLLIPSREF